MKNYFVKNNFFTYISKKAIKARVLIFENPRFFIHKDFVFFIIKQEFSKMKSLVKTVVAVIAGLAVYNWYQNRKAA